MQRVLRSMVLVLPALTTFALSVPATAQLCAGDCNADSVVGVDELVLCTTVGLGKATLADCPPCDVGQDGNVSVDDLVASVGSAIGLLLQGTCRVPCQGAECDAPTANGLIPCAEGTIVQISRCTNRAGCLREVTARTPLGTGMVGSAGAFTVRFDSCQATGSLLLVEADLSAHGGGTFRTLSLFAPGAAAGLGSLSLLDEVAIDPNSEAAVQLLDGLGLENFTDEGIIAVLASFAVANENTPYADQDPATAAATAAEVAENNAAVQEAVTRARLPTPTPTPTSTPTSTPTPTPEPFVAIEVGSASGRPGETVRVDVTVRVSGAEVVATDNRITVSPSTSILSCEANGGSAVILEPQGCSDDPHVNCTAARGVILNSGFRPFENGALLYSCEIEISPTAVSGDLPLLCSDQAASTPNGQPFDGSGRCEMSISVSCETDDDCPAVGGACRILPPTECMNGSISVSGPPVCGNGSIEEGEQCDDGGICVGGPNELASCASSEDCPGGACHPVGGDGCAINCTVERLRRAGLSGDSAAVVQQATFPLSLQLKGSFGLTTGSRRDMSVVDPQGEIVTPPGAYPVVIRSQEVFFEPARVTALVCACPRLVDLFEGRYSAKGTIACGTDGFRDSSYRLVQDHETAPGAPANGNTLPVVGLQLANDPECDDVEILGGGLSKACLERTDAACNNPFARGQHRGTCNSPQVIDFFGDDAPPGGALLEARIAIGLLVDGGLCQQDLPAGDPRCPADYGPDCQPCTDDDADLGMPETVFLTTGLASAAVYDAALVKGRTMDVVDPPVSCDTDEDCAAAQFCIRQCERGGEYCLVDVDCSGDDVCGPPQCSWNGCGTGRFASRCKARVQGTPFDCEALAADVLPDDGDGDGLSGAALAIAFPRIDTLRIGDNLTTVLLGLE